MISHTFIIHTAECINRMNSKMRIPVHPLKIIIIFLLINYYNLQIMIRMKKSQLCNNQFYLLVQNFPLPYQTKMCFPDIHTDRFIMEYALLLIY